VTGFVEKVIVDSSVTGAGISGTADLVLTAEGLISEKVMAYANFNTAAGTVLYPRVTGNTVAAGAPYTNALDKIFVHQSNFKAVVSDADNAKNYRFLILVSDE